MPTAPPEPGGDAARIRCLYCGANNFPASPACWQCGRPLKAASEGVSVPKAGQPAGPFPAAPPPGVSAAPRLPATETALAAKAAAALGLMFPYVGLPVGIVFLMLDDPRKTQLGWITLGWSAVGSILNALALSATLVPALALLKSLAPHAGGAAPSVPGLPNLGGDGLGLRLFGLLAGRFSPLYA